jgi:hypothetical protein
VVNALKRAVVLSLFALLWTVSVFPQKVEEPAKEDNLYSVALFSSIVEMEKQWSQFDDSEGRNGIRTDYHHMLVEKDPQITDLLPLQLGSFRVEYLDRKAQIDRYKQQRKEFSILRIHPMQSDGALVKIQVSVSHLTHEKHKFLLAISDWSDVVFRYDCENQKFVVASVKLGGI